MIKLYVSRTCGNMIMNLQQDHIRRILDSKSIDYEEVDIAAPNRKKEKVFMQSTLKLSDADLVALPPQIFNEKQHRGSYEGFFKALEIEQLYHYLGMQAPPSEVEYQLRQQGSL